MRLFHGSPRREGMLAFGEPGNETPNIRDGRPFFVTDDYGYAEMFARGGTVSVLDIQLVKPVDLYDESVQQLLLGIHNEDPEILSTRGAWDDLVDGDIADSAYFLLESPAVMCFLRQQGFDGAVIPEDLERGVRSYALFNAEQVQLIASHTCAPKPSRGMRM